MKTRTKILIFSGPVVVITLFFGIGFGYSSLLSHGGPHVTYLSDYEFQKELKIKQIKETEIQSISDEDLMPVPKFKYLIDKALKKEFPYNDRGETISDIETLQNNHKYFATILAEKYSRDANDIFEHQIGIDMNSLEEHPDMEQIGSPPNLFKYNDQSYGFVSTVFNPSHDDALALVQVYPSISAESSGSLWAELTDEDLDSMPTVREAMNSIGTLQESITVSEFVFKIEFSDYVEWYKENKLDSRIVEYDGNYFLLNIYQT